MHALQFVLALVFAVAGYQEAQRFSRQTGRTPWGWHPLAWAVVLGLSFIIGIVLIAISERQGRARARHTAPFVPAGYPPPPPMGGQYPSAAGFPPPPPPPTSGYDPGSTVLPNQ
jgi:hypothetical protein